MSDYEPIEDHIPLMNNRTGILVSKGGIIDFGCFPNFDSDPVFFSILDKRVGGYFKLSPESKGIRTLISYENETLIGKSTLTKDDQTVANILWFMPMHSEPSIYFSEIFIRIETLKALKFRLEFAPFRRGNRRFKRYNGSGIESKYGKRIMTLVTDAEFKVMDQVAVGEIEMNAGNIKWIILSYDLDFPLPIEAFHPDIRLNDTRKYWKGWILKSKYEGVEYESVNRSLQIIKGLFFEPTGFMAASLTTSLPESVGGERNWDYRYMWIRDTSFVIEALVKAGYFNEALRFYLSIIDNIEREGKIYSVFSLSGKKADREVISKEFEGYENSKPVRFGNLAGNQLQIDQYVSLIHGLRILIDHGGMPNTHIITKVMMVGKILEKIWDKPDSSIWEIRGPRRQYTYSKVMAWLGFSDLEYLSRNVLFSDSLASEYNKMKEKSRDFIYEKCTWDGKYLSHFAGTDMLDSSLLIAPLIGFIDINDDIFRNTLKEITKRLMFEKYLFKRFEMDDKIKGGDNAFLMISFWYLRDLIRMGKIDEAIDGINFFHKKFNSLQAMPEELEFKSHRYLGNYPQALSHYSWILLIMDLNDALKG